VASGKLASNSVFKIILESFILKWKNQEAVLKYSNVEL
jgi:hypothetical protein